MPWLQVSNLWLLTIGSQGEAKGRSLDFNGNQEAKVLLLETSMGFNYSKSRGVQGNTKELNGDREGKGSKL